MKKESTLKITLGILLILLLTLVGFFGIYKQEKNQMKNILPEYQMGMDLKGYRLVEMQVDTSSKDVIYDKEGKVVQSATEEEMEQNGYTKKQESVNPQEVLSEENYVAVKKILEERLKKNHFSDYALKQNKENGNITLELKDTLATDNMIDVLASNGELKLTDSSTNEVLMTNSDLKEAKVMYNNTDSTGTVVYLVLDFTKQAKAKLEEMSKTYVSSTDQEGNTTEKKIKLTVDDQTLIESSFAEPITKGQLQLAIGSGSTDSATIQGYMNQANYIATLLNTGNLPITYQVQANKYMQASINQTAVKIAFIVTLCVVIMGLIYIIIRYRKNGIITAICYIGFLGAFLLLLRLTHVEITIDSLFAIGLIMITNYLLALLLLTKLKQEGYQKAIKQTVHQVGILAIPFYVIAVVFSFVTYTPVNSFGMTLFWGITLTIAYHYLFTKTMITEVNRKDVEE